jgi:hypothetical protein
VHARRTTSRWANGTAAPPTRSSTTSTRSRTGSHRTCSCCRATTSTRWTTATCCASTSSIAALTIGAVRIPVARGQPLRHPAGRRRWPCHGLRREAEDQRARDPGRARLLPRVDGHLRVRDAGAREAPARRQRDAGGPRRRLRPPRDPAHDRPGARLRALLPRHRRGRPLPTGATSARSTPVRRQHGPVRREAAAEPLRQGLADLHAVAQRPAGEDGVLRVGDGRRAEVQDSLLCPGVVVSGGKVRRSCSATASTSTSTASSTSAS